jgi:hypothetical protein
MDISILLQVGGSGLVRARFGAPPHEKRRRLLAAFWKNSKTKIARLER